MRFVIASSVSLGILLGAASASAQNVLVWSTGNSSGTPAIASWLQASGQFTSVTGIDQTNMTLSTLLTYDALLFFTNSSTGSDPNNGNVLADYADTGRRLVLATFSWANQAANTLGGRIINDQISPVLTQGNSLYSNVTMASNDGSALFTGVNTIMGHFHDNVMLSAGAVQRAAWSDGEPLVAQKANVIAINLFPNDMSGNVSGDYRALFVNALDASGCGDGQVQTGEQCDDAGESAICNDDCTTAVCGDAKLNVTSGEDCDDGAETATCNADCSLASCGDGVLNATAGESCDDGGESATCNDDCTPASCGDGIRNATAGETCDDGNTEAGDGCSPTCASETTGSGGVGGSGAGGATSSSGAGAGKGPSGSAGEDDDDTRVDSGCGCFVAGGGEGDRLAMSLGMVALAALLSRRRLRPRG